MFVNKLFTYLTYISKLSSTHYFHMKAKILADFQICISVPLNTSVEYFFNWSAGLKFVFNQHHFSINLNLRLSFKPFGTKVWYSFPSVFIQDEQIIASVQEKLSEIIIWVSWTFLGIIKTMLFIGRNENTTVDGGLRAISFKITVIRNVLNNFKPSCFKLLRTFYIPIYLVFANIFEQNFHTNCQWLNKTNREIEKSRETSNSRTV